MHNLGFDFIRAALIAIIVILAHHKFSPFLKKKLVLMPTYVANIIVVLMILLCFFTYNPLWFFGAIIFAAYFSSAKYDEMINKVKNEIRNIIHNG